MGKGILLGAVALAALVGIAMSGGSAKAEPEPSPGPGPFPGPGPMPVPSTKGLDVASLAKLASDDVALHGWHSGRGVVRAFEIAYNATSGLAPIKVDDKWGPENYHAALSLGIVNPTPAYFNPK